MITFRYMVLIHVGMSLIVSLFISESSTHTGKKEDVAMLLNSYVSATTSKSLSTGKGLRSI